MAKKESLPTTDMKSLIRSLDFHDDGVRLTSLTFSISLFTNVLLTDIPEAVLRCQEIFFEFCPKELIKFYATDTMRKHRPVTKKVFGMLDVWMQNPETKTDYITLELKDGDMLGAPKHLFKVVGCQKGSRGYKEKLANSLCFAFPPEYGVDRPGEMLTLVKTLCAIIPVHSGTAGFAFHCSRYVPQEAEAYAWQKSIRHPEIDIVRLPQDIHAVGQNAVKTIGWLTIADDDFVKTLGGIASIKKRLGSSADVLRTAGRYILQIGDAPTISDRNRGQAVPAYTTVYRVFEPLIDLAREQSQWFDTGGDDEDDQTEAWYRRFEK